MAVGWCQKLLVVVVLCSSCLSAPLITTMKSDLLLPCRVLVIVVAVSGTIFAFLLVVVFLLVLIELYFCCYCFFVLFVFLFLVSFSFFASRSFSCCRLGDAKYIAGTVPTASKNIKTL